MTSTRHTSVEPHRLVPAAATAAVVALALTLTGSYVRTPWQHDQAGGWAINPDRHGPGELWFLVAFVALAAVVVFGVLVARGLRADPQRTAWRAVALGVAGAASLAVFWTGLPVIIAASATVLAFDARDRLGHLTAPVIGALALAAATCVLAVALAFTG